MVQCDQCQDWFNDDYVTVTVLFEKEKILADSVRPVYC